MGVWGFIINQSIAGGNGAGWNTWELRQQKKRRGKEEEVREAHCTQACCLAQWHGPMQTEKEGDSRANLLNTPLLISLVSRGKKSLLQTKTMMTGDKQLCTKKSEAGKILSLSLFCCVLSWFHLKWGIYDITIAGLASTIVSQAGLKFMLNPPAVASQ